MPERHARLDVMPGVIRSAMALYTRHAFDGVGPRRL
jgi:hypothetical protein